MTRVTSLATIRLMRLIGMSLLFTMFSTTAAWAYWEGECEEDYYSEGECWEEEGGDVDCPSTLIGVKADGTTERLTLSSTTEGTRTTSTQTSFSSRVEGSCPLRACSGSLGGETSYSESITYETEFGKYVTATGYIVEVDCWSLTITRQGSSLQ